MVLHAVPTMTLSAAPPPSLRVPTHVAIIMDGNGRWAERKGLPRGEGHRAGADTVDAVTTACREMGVRYLTLYAFSSENWQRPADEVTTLMGLLVNYLDRQRKKLRENNIELYAVGDLTRLPLAARAALNAVISETRGLTGMRLTLALSYGARDEMVRAARLLATRVQRGELKPEEIDEAAVAGVLDTRDMPDPDIIVRTAGEQRLSNFLLWQAAYAEFVFIDKLWPDFSRGDLETAFAAYAKRTRRFGKTDGQLKG